MVPYNPDDLVALMAASEENLTARAYIRKISRHLGIPTVEARKILKTLVNSRKVAYHSLYGSTYVMESFLKPVRLTDRFTIVPPGYGPPREDAPVPDPGDRDLRIVIHQGISFGSGHHPTTRLCLEGLDLLFSENIGAAPFPGTAAGDVGTGSGILAIAACLAGMKTCRAWDIDANAVSEARQNAAASGLEDRVTVIDDHMPPQNPPLALICANLRYPTLKQLAPLFRKSLLPGGYLILSGLRDWEQTDLVSAYQAVGFSLVWDKTLKHWTGMVLHRPATSETTG